MSEEDEKPPKESITSKSSRKSNIKILIDKFGDDLWEICEVDETHYVRKKDVNHHKSKCKKKALKSPRKTECPFNPMHIINLMEIEQHILTCPNRVTLLNSLYDFEPKRETIEGVAMESVNVLPDIPNDWDNEEHPERGYDPMDSTKFRTVLRQTPPGLSKSQKKAWKEKERQRWKWLDGETKEKARPSPYPNPRDVKNVKPSVKNEGPVKEEGIQSLIDGLDGAAIADPRDGMLKRIKNQAKLIKLIEQKLVEEKSGFRRLLEVYKASLVKTEEKPEINEDPRIAPKTSPDKIKMEIDNDDHLSRILPDIMTSAMIR